MGQIPHHAEQQQKNQTAPEQELFRPAVFGKPVRMPHHADDGSPSQMGARTAMARFSRAAPGMSRCSSRMQKWDYPAAGAGEAVIFWNRQGMRKGVSWVMRK